MEYLIVKKLQRAFSLYDELIEFIPEEYLSQKVLGSPSNELGQQLWCVIGARNSYLKALKAGSWQGFECPLKWGETGSKKSIAGVLQSTASETIQYLESNSKYDMSVLLDLLEHEIQHHGQIIRYLYAFKLGVPDGWKKRYNLD